MARDEEYLLDEECLLEYIELHEEEYFTIYNARSSPMSSLFLTVLPPTLLCARLLVLISRSSTRYHTHVSELSA